MNHAHALRPGRWYETSQPYKPGDSVYWTIYTYDGLGRTTQVTAADGASHTSYAYYGSTSVVTDPAGNWKAMTTDVDGNLKSVIEPDPAYSPGALRGCAEHRLLRVRGLHRRRWGLVTPTTGSRTWLR